VPTPGSLVRRTLTATAVPSAVRRFAHWVAAVKAQTMREQSVQTSLVALVERSAALECANWEVVVWMEAATQTMIAMAGVTTT